MERHCTTKSNRNVPYNSPTALQKQYHAKPNTWALSACTSATTASIMEDGISTNKLLCTQACVERWKSLLQPYKAASMLECKLTSAEEGSYFWTPLHHCGNHFAFAMEQTKKSCPIRVFYHFFAFPSATHCGLLAHRDQHSIWTPVGSIPPTKHLHLADAPKSHTLGEGGEEELARHHHHH